MTMHNRSYNALRNKTLPNSSNVPKFSGYWLSFGKNIRILKTTINLDDYLFLGFRSIIRGNRGSASGCYRLFTVGNVNPHEQILRPQVKLWLQVPAWRSVPAFLIEGSVRAHFLCIELVVPYSEYVPPPCVDHLRETARL
mmetsp:Transcript_38979/g.83191  ORF Transcript_38979/g.83191 Transcript_38979/m.83191 type:complete len:140 (-) Transcript_38979:1036-1455(-)